MSSPRSTYNPPSDSALDHGSGAPKPVPMAPVHTLRPAIPGIAIVGRAIYRTRQVMESLRAGLSEDDRRLVADYLSPAAWSLFDSMLPRDQYHAVRVFRTLRQWGWQDRDLLTAALLHDVGKGAEVKLWHRVAYVILAAVAPRLLERSAGDEIWLRSWGRAMSSLRQHPQRGGELAVQAGCSDATARLIHQHEDKCVEVYADSALAALRAADELC